MPTDIVASLDDRSIIIDPLQLGQGPEARVNEKTKIHDTKRLFAISNLYWAQKSKGVSVTPSQQHILPIGVPYTHL